MGGTRIRCAQCGAKNNADVRMCRICGRLTPDWETIRLRTLAPEPVERFIPVEVPVYASVASTITAEPPPLVESPPQIIPAPPAPQPLALPPRMATNGTTLRPPPLATQAPTRPAAPTQPVAPRQTQPTRPTRPVARAPKQWSRPFVVLGAVAASAVLLFTMWELLIHDDRGTTALVESPTRTFPSTTSRTTSLEEWSRFKDPEGHFIALLPGDPTRVEHELVSARDPSAKIPLTSYEVHSDASDAVVVAVHNVEADSGIDVQATATAVADALGGTITASAPTTDRDGHQALDVAIKLGGDISRLRVISAGSRIYLLESYGPDALESFHRLVAGFTAN